jgi:hypothetical protein
MTSYLPSAQVMRGDGYLDQARNLRDLWKSVIPRSDLIILQNRITMLVFFAFLSTLLDIHSFRMSRATDMRAGLDTKSGLSKISHARMYSKYSKETFHFAKVLDLVSGLCMYSFNRVCTRRPLLNEPETSYISTRLMTSNSGVLPA